MAADSAQVEEKLLQAVCALVRERLEPEQAQDCETFVRQYYRWVPLDDLSERDPQDLLGAALAHWELAQYRGVHETKLRLGGADVETNGWSSPHTVLEIVTDDMPFLVDSVVMELSRSGYGTHLVIHPVIRVTRDADGKLTAIAPPGGHLPGDQAESVIHMELDREGDPERLESLRVNLERVLSDVRAAVEDWTPMRTLALSLAEQLGDGATGIPQHDLDEAKAFLRWLSQNRFLFLGCRRYDLVRTAGGARLDAVPGSGLGILRGEPSSPSTSLGKRALALALERQPLLLTNANSRATVHRPAYLDYVGVRHFDANGNVTGESRFLGLYTSAAYRETALEIPIVRDKVTFVLEQAGFPLDSHDAKALTEICEAYPRQALFQMAPAELLRAATGILALGERQRIRLFTREDALGRFVACIVCLPRDRVTTESRELITRTLLEAFDGSHFDWSLERTESTVARMHFLIHTRSGIPEYDEEALERRLSTAIRDWRDDLREALLARHGDTVGLSLYRRYGAAFPPGYQADWDASTAIEDIAELERLRQEDGPIVRLHRPAQALAQPLRCRLISRDPLSLSDVLPKLERMGAPVTGERPYQVQAADGQTAWIYDFGLSRDVPDVESVHERFEHAFLGVWHGDFEHDRLGALVLDAGLTAERVVILRALSRYLQQAWVGVSDRQVESALVHHPGIAVPLVELFDARLDPEARDQAAARRLSERIEKEIDQVESLEEDRILRTVLAAIHAILRTNYFMVPARPYLSFKLDPTGVGVLPLPLPQYSIWVYSPRVEGIHLRGGKVARGGIRWSDRSGDFRTEILGLMKAQMVKNAVIVPVGSKGGFVVKQPPATGGRDALQAEGIECYRTFLRGLLDITDNIVGGKVVPPTRVVRYDDDDPYLVVAADKGTASFSDIANAVSAEYGFWLGDAFASGGSRGYDHKAMGITARGAWESVKRHFREMGSDIQLTPFTVVGIGDMSGDVFGNGMLLSKQIRLLAAFNHLHIFIDPDPDPSVSFAERKRLYELPRSSWAEYDRALISAGGGVYERTVKSIPISPQAQAALGIEEAEMPPDALISRILKAPVDLLWNGGIGTYVKASDETHLNVGDRTNDALRINGRDLRCRVVGEGGNLGFTQLGRVEYALAGGRINTDALDNVAGVNTSDHEVNIKILLDALVTDGELSSEQRNSLLVEMTDSVAASVIGASYAQTEALSLTRVQADQSGAVHARLIRELEQSAALNPEVEFLPDEEQIEQRAARGRGLTAPELAVLMAYCKISLHFELLESDLPEDPYLAHDLERYFPAPLAERFRAQMRGHRLRREIIATAVANQLVNRAGITFISRLREETGADAAQLTRAYACARSVYAIPAFWEAVEGLDSQVDSGVQLSMLIDARRLVEAGARWLVRAHVEDPAFDIAALVKRYAPGAQLLSQGLPDLLNGQDATALQERVDALTEAGVPVELAMKAASMPFMLPVFDIVEVALATGQDLAVVMAASFRIEAAMREMRNLVPGALAPSAR